MTKRNFRFSFFLIFFLFLPFFSALNAFAEFNLTVLSSEGGTDIHFERLASGDFKENMQMRLTVNSTLGKQYRVTQQIIKPLATDEGELLPSEQFKMYALVNSNSRGTLIYREELPVDRFDTVLYTSDPAGSDDSFQLVYTMEPQELQRAGRYYGVISYVLEPMDSTASQVVVTANVYAELEAGAVPVVDIETNTGSSRLVLNSENIGRQDQYEPRDCPRLDIKVSGPLGKKYRIYQSFEGGAVNSSSGQQLDLSRVLFSIEDGEKGKVLKDGDLTQALGKQLIYTSDLNGSGDDLSIIYKPAEGFRLFPAGLYRGSLSYSIETDEVVEKIKTVDFEFNIVKVFDLHVFSGGQEGFSLNFGTASFKDGLQSSFTQVYVESNLGEPYQVVQKVERAMMNEKGDELAPDDFMMRVKDINSSELQKYSLQEFTPVRLGDIVVFSSGPKGESSSFAIEYCLKLDPDTRAGSYSAKIGYSLLQD